MTGYILIPLAFFYLFLGYSLLDSPVLQDHVVLYTTSFAKLTTIPIIASVVSYLAFCFALVAMVRTISPLPDQAQPKPLRFLQASVELVCVAAPNATLLALVLLVLPIHSNKLLLSFVALAILVGLIATLVATFKRLPIVLFCSNRTRFTRTDLSAILCIIFLVSIAIAYALWPAQSAHAFGLLPVVLLAVAALFILTAAISTGESAKTVSFLLVIIVLAHALDRFVYPLRQFSHTTVQLSGAQQQAPAAIKSDRGIKRLDAAFLEWLFHRKASIMSFAANGKSFPVFLVSAQGGGVVAAYHPALSLARLTDACPEFADHLFSITGVSGGALGAALYSELLRSSPPSIAQSSQSNTKCRSRDLSTRTLEGAVQSFFGTDFLTPVAANAILFDVPSLIVPQLRFGQDRALALEASFEAGWAHLTQSKSAKGLASNFYGTWLPQDRAPALFLATTSVTHGLPVLISQIDWSYDPNTPARDTVRAVLLARRSADPLEAEGEALKNQVKLRMSTPEEYRASIPNILDFRPDVQLRLSAAIVLSARFPVVTPSGLIARNRSILQRSDSLFARTEVLQLTDGGIYDNSGGIITRRIVDSLQAILDQDDRFADFRGKVKLNIISFTNIAAPHHSLASLTAVSEISAPLTALDAVRQTRGGSLEALPPSVEGINVALLDEWFEGFLLSWLLSEDDRRAVEKRSTWMSKSDHLPCCEVFDPDTRKTRRIALSPEQAKTLQRLGFGVSETLPNQRQLLRVMDLVSDGAEPLP